jgi:hypothetical protein
VLCNLAVDAMEELQEDQNQDGAPGFTFSVVDASTREGVKRLQELRPSAGRQIPVPGVMVDGVVVFERIPDMEEFGEWLQSGAAASAAES